MHETMRIKKEIVSAPTPVDPTWRCRTDAQSYRSISGSIIQMALRRSQIITQWYHIRKSKGLDLYQGRITCRKVRSG
eukprot:766961-Hanusia_phi.AAC.1